MTGHASKATCTHGRHPRRSDVPHALGIPRAAGHMGRPAHAAVPADAAVPAHAAVPADAAVPAGTARPAQAAAAQAIGGTGHQAAWTHRRRHRLRTSAASTARFRHRTPTRQRLALLSGGIGGTRQ